MAFRLDRENEEFLKSSHRRTPIIFICPEIKSSQDFKSTFGIEKGAIFIEYEHEIANWLIAYKLPSAHIFLLSRTGYVLCARANIFILHGI